MGAQRRLHFGIKTAQLQASPEALLDVWHAADAIPAFEHAWLNDHLLAWRDQPADPCLEGWTLLTALAAQTKHLRIGIMATANTFRSPGLLAKMAATVDILSSGRLIFGMGTGWWGWEHRAYGISLPPPGERIRRLDEACERIQ